MTDFAVYDNATDEVVGVWNTYADAVHFFEENSTDNDLWEVFPWIECLAPVTK